MWRKNTSPSNTQKWSVVDWVPTRYFFLFLTVFVNCARPPTDTSRTWHRYLSCMLDVRWIFWITCGSVVRCSWIYFIFHGLNAMTSTVTTNAYFFDLMFSGWICLKIITKWSVLVFPTTIIFASWCGQSGNWRETVVWPNTNNTGPSWNERHPVQVGTYVYFPVSKLSSF